MDKMKKKQIYMRTKKIVTLFVILFSLLISRLFWIQIVKGLAIGMWQISSMQEK